MFEPDVEDGTDSQNLDKGKEGEGQGDGLHHHEIHEDEAGGYQSLHTFPDGHTQPGDHVDYDEAKADMDQCFGCGDSQDDDKNDAGEKMGGMNDSDIAGSYGRSAGRG